LDEEQLILAKAFTLVTWSGNYVNLSVGHCHSSPFLSNENMKAKIHTAKVKKKTLKRCQQITNKKQQATSQLGGERKTA